MPPSTPHTLPLPKRKKEKENSSVQKKIVQASSYEKHDIWKVEGSSTMQHSN